MAVGAVASPPNWYGRSHPHCQIMPCSSRRHNPLLTQIPGGGAIDALVERFGPDVVSQITGRARLHLSPAAR
jgi:hypothetical protein